ncbi:hypothetical protein TNCV_73921 [Trichonephila clavipes]|nr:hypothetical protein TNCV_73921 [Trichonephila clavipes]
MRLQMVWLVKTAIKILHMVGALFFQKFLPRSNRISVTPGGRPPYMSGMKETFLVLLCLGQAEDEMKLHLLGSQGTYSSSSPCDGSQTLPSLSKLQCNSSSSFSHLGSHWLPYETAAIKSCYSSSMFKIARLHGLDLDASVD